MNVLSISDAGFYLCFEAYLAFREEFLFVVVFEMLLSTACALDLVISGCIDLIVVLLSVFVKSNVPEISFGRE